MLAQLSFFKKLLFHKTRVFKTFAILFVLVFLQRIKSSLVGHGRFFCWSQVPWSALNSVFRTQGLNVQTLV